MVFVKSSRCKWVAEILVIPSERPIAPTVNYSVGAGFTPARQNDNNDCNRSQDNLFVTKVYGMSRLKLVARLFNRGLKKAIKSFIDYLRG